MLAVYITALNVQKSPSISTYFCTVPSARIHDPVVLKGSELPELLGVPTWQLLGFNFNSSGQWTQVPIQIDEMHYQKWDVIKHVPDCRKVYISFTFHVLILII